MRAIVPIVGRAPRPFYFLASIIGWVGWHLRPPARTRAIRNLLPVCAGDQRTARSASLHTFLNVARYYVDLATLPYRNHTTFESEHVQVIGEQFIPSLFEPRPTIIASAHTGNPELGLIAISGRGGNWVELVETLAPPARGRFIARLRAAAGGRIHQIGIAGARAALSELRKGGMVALLADRNLQGRGVCVHLFERDVQLPRGPWELARQTGATVVPLFVTRGHTDDITVRLEEPFQVCMTTDREADVHGAAQRWADLFATQLRRDPGQWTVLEDYWAVHRCG